jgi:Barstar (barnase inhibitor)
MVLVRVHTTKIRDWASFHDVFSETFGFPDLYGRNMDAWIDCMASLDDPAAGMSKIHAPEGGVLTLQLDGVDGFAERCPEQYRAVVDCCAFVNWRRIEVGQPAVLALSYYRSR